MVHRAGTVREEMAEGNRFADVLVRWLRFAFLPGHHHLVVREVLGRQIPVEGEQPCVAALQRGDGGEEFGRGGEEEEIMWFQRYSSPVEEGAVAGVFGVALVGSGVEAEEDEGLD